MVSIPLVPGLTYPWYVRRPHTMSSHSAIFVGPPRAGAGGQAHLAELAEGCRSAARVSSSLLLAIDLRSRLDDPCPIGLPTSGFAVRLGMAHEICFAFLGGPI